MSTLQGRYSADLRRTFRKYALIPVILLVCLSYAAVSFFSYFSLSNRVKNVGRSFSSRLEAMTEICCQKAEELSEDDMLLTSLRQMKTVPKMYERLYGFVNAQDIRCRFYIHSSDGTLLYCDTKESPQFSKNSGYITRALSSTDRALITVESNNGENVLCISKAITDNGTAVGFLYFVLEKEAFVQFQEAQEVVDIVLSDQFHHVCWSTDPMLIGRFGKSNASWESKNGFVRVDSVPYYVLTQRIADDRLTITTLADFSLYQSMLTVLALFLLGVMALTFLGISFASAHLARKKTMAIDTFMQGISRLQEGSFDRIIINTDDEFQSMADAYNQMLQNMEHLMHENEKKAFLTAASELKQLEAQFNPHFLFNTLEIIRYNLYLEPEKADKAIMALSELLRYSLNASAEVQLSQEIRYAGCYLNIQKIRLDNSFSYQLSIEDDAYDCYVPKLILQPILENAFKYGYSGQKDFNLTVSARKENDSLFIEISNNGTQISPDALDEIIRNMNTAENRPKHFGLYGIHKRLKLLYGEGYGLQITSTDKATSVSVYLPYTVSKGGDYAQNADS